MTCERLLMHDPANIFPRITLPRTPANKPGSQAGGEIYAKLPGTCPARPVPTSYRVRSGRHWGTSKASLPGVCEARCGAIVVDSLPIERASQTKMPRSAGLSRVVGPGFEPRTL
jgi:hypothetical protein